MQKRMQLGEALFETPGSWADRTVVILEAPPSKAPGTSIIVTQSELQSGENIRGFGDRQLVELAKRMQAFSLMGRMERMLGRTPAAALRYQWASTNGPAYQHIVSVADKSRVVTVFTATSTPEHIALCDTALEEVISSLRWRGEML